MGDFTYIQWRRTSGGAREVVVQTARGSDADQKRFVVTSLDQLPEWVAGHLRDAWDEPLRYQRTA